MNFIFTELFHVQLLDNSLSKGFPWACQRTRWETHRAHLLNAERQFVSLGENSPEQVYGCVRDRQRQ